MSQWMKKLGVGVLSAFLILSFAIWGVGDMFRGSGVSQTVATVGDSEIARQDLNDQFRRVLNVMRDRLGAGFDRQQALQIGLLDQTLDQIVNGRLLVLEAQSLGLRAGDDLVRTAIQKAPEFQGVSSAFDPLRFREFLQREGFGSEGAYVQVLRQELLRRQLTGAVIAGIDPPGRLTELLYSFRNEQRVAEVAAVPTGDPKSLPDPDPAALAEFHKANPGQFTAPEYRQLTALYLDPVAAAAEIQVPEERLREEFEYRRPSLSVPERRELQQLLFQDEAKARDVSAAIKEGRSFEKAAEDIAQTKPTALGRLRKSDLPPSIADAVFALQSGSVSDPLRSPLGWHVVRVASIEPGKTPSFDDVRQQIRNDVAREMAVDSLTRLTNQIDDTMAGGGKLEDAAAKVNAKLLQIAAIDARGLDRAGKPVPDLPRDPKFLNSAFSTPAGASTTIEETNDGGFFVIRVDNVMAPALRPLDQVRDQVVTAWKNRQLLDAARKTAETVRDDAKSLGSLAKAAEKHGLAVTTSKPFTRFTRESGSPVSDGLAAELFRVKEGGIAMAEGGTGFQVGQLRQIIPARPAPDSEDVKSLDQQLRSGLADDMLQAYLTALKNRYTVRINREAVDSIIGGGG